MQKQEVEKSLQIKPSPKVKTTLRWALRLSALTTTGISIAMFLARVIAIMSDNMPVDLVRLYGDITAIIMCLIAMALCTLCALTSRS